MAKAISRVTGIFTKINNSELVTGFVRPRLQAGWVVAKRELGPPAVNDIPQIKAAAMDLVKKATTGQFMNTSVRNSFRNTLVTVEVLMWFFVGEIIGRRSLVGYNTGEYF